MLAALPDESRRRQQELDLQIALGQALMAAKGYAAPEVMDTLARARVLAEQLDRPDDSMALLHFQWCFHWFEASTGWRCRLAEQMERRAKRVTIKPPCWWVAICRVPACYFLGEFADGARTFSSCVTV